MIVAGWLRIAEASCAPPPPLPLVVTTAHDVFVVTFDKERAEPPFLVVEATVVSVHAGCAEPGEAVEVWFSDDDDIRPAWTLGRDYLLSTSEGVDPQRTWSCGVFGDAAFLTDAERAFLGSRPLSCGGVVTCQDASPPATCPDTCAEVSCPGATCAVNPCDACALEQFDLAGVPQADADGDLVCDEADLCPGTDDRADADGDTVCDALDVCPDGDDRQDGDRDGVPDACEAPIEDTAGPNPPPPPPADPVVGGAGGCRCDGTARPVVTAPLLVAAVLRRRRSRTP